MRHTNKNQYKNITERTIYVIKSPLTEECFVGHCRKDLLISVYQHHKYGERNATRTLCEGLNEQELRPCLYIIETVQCTKTEAYKHVVVWVKIISDSGYIVVNQGDTKSYSEDLLEENERRYNERKHTSIANLFRCNNCVVATYNRKQCPAMKVSIDSSGTQRPEQKRRLRDKEIKMRLSEEEYNQIVKNAKACDKTTVAYLRELGLNMCIVPMDLSIVTEHTSVITSYRNAINQLLFTIKKTGNYTPADLEYILEKTRDLLKAENKFLELYELHLEQQIEKVIPETVTEIVNRNMKKISKTTKTKA